MSEMHKIIFFYDILKSTCIQFYGKLDRKILPCTLITL